jgi:hypothetical protein
MEEFSSTAAEAYDRANSRAILKYNIRQVSVETE